MCESLKYGARSGSLPSNNLDLVESSQIMAGEQNKLSVQQMVA